MAVLKDSKVKHSINKIQTLSTNTKLEKESQKVLLQVSNFSFAWCSDAIGSAVQSFAKLYRTLEISLEIDNGRYWHFETW